MPTLNIRVKLDTRPRSASGVTAWITVFRGIACMASKKPRRATIANDVQNQGESARPARHAA